MTRLLSHSLRPFVRPLAKLGLSLASLVACLVLFEVALQITQNPVNFLKPRLVDDLVLGHRVAPHSAGHDAWGFRNASLPETVEIVAVGDSQTYGVSAMANASWPAWLERLTGNRVYNLSLGGYGPIQYEYLLREKALGLKPKVVVLGVYLGNDLFDAWRVVYGLEFWHSFRSDDPGIPEFTYASVEREKGGGLPIRMRRWLSRESILYRLVVTALGQVLGRVEMAVRDLDPGITVLRDPDLQTAFTPVARLRALDFRRREITEGMRLSLEAFARIQVLCEEAGTRLVVLLIPTKEAVFEDRLRNRPELSNAKEIEELLDYEARARAELAAFLTVRGIPVVDPRAAMLEASRLGPIYPSNEGGHPVSSGYRAIAEAVAAELDRLSN